jgi:hypothetical protein
MTMRPFRHYPEHGPTFVPAPARTFRQLTRAPPAILVYEDGVPVEIVVGDGPAPATIHVSTCEAWEEAVRQVPHLRSLAPVLVAWRRLNQSE